MSAALSCFWLTMHNMLPLWHMRKDWRGDLWYYVASRSWYWYERKEGRI